MKKRNVFLAPLNWGLGHANRCIPVIRELIEKDDNVIVAGSPAHLQIFTHEFSEIKTVKIPFARVRFNGKKNLLLSFLCQMPGFLIQILREHYALKKIIKKYEIDLVISDNCYGLWNKNVYTIFITHQVNLMLPRYFKRLSNLANKINQWFIQHYDECWIPDIEANGGFSGKLSHGFLINVQIKYIGILSRFNNRNIDIDTTNFGDGKRILFLISGPENQRTVFEQLIKNQIQYIPDDYEFTVVRGLPSEKPGNISNWYNHLTSDELMKLIINADVIICRSGYSTIMDLIALQKTALLIPTPGQAEQEYLAGHLASKNIFCTMNQEDFKIRPALEKLQDWEQKKENLINKLQ
jgi:uncharacterized protein (TIGR00661 family)